ncbi:MAG TPA: hypothetical protein VM198_02330, partial [Longimicrobiales bacterium]|nr:hypothetical protein [Longimicrobiales bacterium]
MALATVRAWVAERVRGQTWWLRAPLLLVLAWILHGYLTDSLNTSIFDGVNLAFHEMGHAAFIWFRSRILTVAGGTIFQLGIPITAGAYLLHNQRDPFGAAVCVFLAGDGALRRGSLRGGRARPGAAARLPVRAGRRGQPRLDRHAHAVRHAHAGRGDRRGVAPGRRSRHGRVARRGSVDAAADGFHREDVEYVASGAPPAQQLITFSGVISEKATMRQPCGAFITMYETPSTETMPPVEFVRVLTP